MTTPEVQQNAEVKKISSTVEAQTKILLDKEKTLDAKKKAAQALFEAGFEKKLVAYKNGNRYEFPPSQNTLPDTAKSEEKTVQTEMLKTLNAGLQKIYTGAPNDTLPYQNAEKKQETTPINTLLAGAHLDAVAERVKDRTTDMKDTAVSLIEANGHKTITADDILTHKSAIKDPELQKLLSKTTSSELNDDQKKALETISTTLNNKVDKSLLTQAATAGIGLDIAATTSKGLFGGITEKTTSGYEGAKEGIDAAINRMKNPFRQIDNPWTALCAFLGIAGVSAVAFKKFGFLNTIMGLVGLEIGSTFAFGQHLPASLASGFSWLTDILKGVGKTGEKIAGSVIAEHTNEAVSVSEITQAHDLAKDSKGTERAKIVEYKDLGAAFAMGAITMKSILGAKENEVIKVDDTAKKIQFFPKNDSLEKIYGKDSDEMKVLEKIYAKDTENKTPDEKQLFIKEKLATYMQSLFLNIYTSNPKRVDAYMDYSKKFTLSTDTQNKEYQAWKGMKYAESLFAKKDALLKTPKLSAGAKSLIEKSLDPQKATIVDLVVILQERDESSKEVQKLLKAEENKIITDPNRKIY